MAIFGYFQLFLTIHQLSPDYFRLFYPFLPSFYSVFGIFLLIGISRQSLNRIQQIALKLPNCYLIHPIELMRDMKELKTILIFAI